MSEEERKWWRKNLLNAVVYTDSYESRRHENIIPYGDTMPHGDDYVTEVLKSLYSQWMSRERPEGMSVGGFIDKAPFEIKVERYLTKEVHNMVEMKLLENIQIPLSITATIMSLLMTLVVLVMGAPIFVIPFLGVLAFSLYYRRELIARRNGLKSGLQIEPYPHEK